MDIWSSVGCYTGTATGSLLGGRFLNVNTYTSKSLLVSLLC